MFTIEEILKATSGNLLKGERKRRVSAVSIDSRSIRPKELFVTIKGLRFDGHNFIAQARRKGAGGILFSDTGYVNSILEGKSIPNIPMVRVKNTVQALGELAHYYRERFSIPVVAVTGSNGKTTTKEMLVAILNRRFNLLYSRGTQNNHLGVPLTILGLRKKHNLVVVEIGANHPGEIDWLSWIIQPNVAIITNIGPSHLEFFKSLKGVYKAKLELLKNLTKDAKLIINSDDRFLAGLNKANLQKVTFGFNQFAHFYGQIIEQTEQQSSFLLNKRHRIKLKVLGRHNVYNALASIACARSLGASFNEIKRGLSLFKAPPMRMQMLKVDNMRIINDCYNSNPESFECALDFLREYPAQGKKIVVCGDMLELGARAKNFHMNLGKRMAKDKIDFLVTVGSLAKDTGLGAQLAGMEEGQIRIFRQSPEAAEFLRRIVQPKDIILIKGSRAMKMEQVLACFTESFFH